MTSPFQIQIAGEIVSGWTSARLRRSRKELTGELTIECFYGSIPANPVLRDIKAGAEIIVMIAGQTAFTGTIDKREGRGKQNKKNDGESQDDDSTFQHAVEIGKGAYTVTVSARGKAKRLIDSSHDHPTGTMKNCTPAQIVQTLIKNHKLKLDDRSGDNTQIEKARFRDGATVFSEIVRWTVEHNLMLFEHTDGTLKLITPGDEQNGIDLILGENIIEFSAEQSEDQQNSEITVKGQRTGSVQYGTDAVQCKKVAKQSGSSSDYSPWTIQLTGDATDDRLKKRLKVENRLRQEASKNITLDVFHVQGSNGSPWDIGLSHYVEIPPENIFDTFIVDELEYRVDADGEIRTTLTLVASQSSEDGARSDSQARGDARQAKLGVPNTPGQYPDIWSIGQMIFS